MVTAMRVFVLLTALLLDGCAAARVTVKGAEGEIHFEFDGGSSRGLDTSAVSVYEASVRQRGRTVCNLVQNGDSEHPKLTEWAYGREMAGYHFSQQCEVLTRGRRYGVAVYLTDRRVIGTDFELNSDGSVRVMEATR
jgi:hypothetical protein